MIDLAKRVISGEIVQESIQMPKILREKRGVFCSVYVSGNLRGCIGTLEPVKALFDGICDNATFAAYHDSRFKSITSGEMKNLEVEISVLSVPIGLRYNGSVDLQKKIESKGVIIRKDGQGATFLPQVWKELPQSEKFLSQLCLKAGLDPNEWKKGTLQVWTYQAEVFRG
jgi:AmmeMemoRadiSam system protein A